MRYFVAVALIAASSSVCLAAGLPRSTPEAQGVSSAGILAFVDAADQNVESMNSFMLLRHGHVVAEGWWAPYRAEAPHSLYSLSKSFTSTAVGLAIAEGKLSLDDEVLKFFPDDAPAKPSNNLKSMRVSDLLRMSTGQQAEPPRTSSEPWTKTFLAQPVPFKPGTHFLYNTSATYMLSAIVQKATGMTVLDYLKPRLFDPLGIEHPTWETSPQGISAGGYGLSIRTEDIARFGQLYLQKGKWEGQAARARELGRGRDFAENLQRQQPAERLGPRLLLSVLALPARRLSRRRGVRPILHRHARAGRGGRHHQRRERHAGGAEPGVGQASAGDERHRRCRRTTTPGQNSNRS